MDLDDFSAGAATLVDACAFPSSIPNSNSVDCVLFQACTMDSQCDDANACTTDTCDTSVGACRHTPDTGASCGDSSDTVCDDPDACNSLGFCQDNNEPTSTSCRAAPEFCDVEEFCDGAGSCPADGFEPGTTLCRAAVDACDAAEFCTGSSEFCPANGFQQAGTACGSGSDMDCDNPDSCNGAGTCDINNEGDGTNCGDQAVECLQDDECASGACQDNGFETSGTACGGAPSGSCDLQDACDSAGVCQANFEPSTTVCNAGSGDICDPDELCPGVADQACPADGTASQGTVCNVGSGDICDPDEVCSGQADQACPADGFDDGSTVCNAGSGDICDPDELCPGVADAACPADIFDPGTTVCRTGSGDVCDPDELCPGEANAACPADIVASDGTACGNPGDGVCDLQDTCDGSGACDDNVEPTGADCTDDEFFCNGDEVCSATGTCESPGDPCPGTECNTCQEESDTCFDDPSTGCGDSADNECTDPDTCNAFGFCEPNNEACAAVTSSALCTFDVSPKGVCVDGSGIPNGDVCDTQTGDPACNSGTCVEENQFRLLFTPDGRNWPAHKLTASNPGQFFYNLFSDASTQGSCENNQSPCDTSIVDDCGQGIACIQDCAGNMETFEIKVPYPFVTQGATPVHVYDGSLVSTEPSGVCVDDTTGLQGDTCDLIAFPETGCAEGSTCSGQCFIPPETALDEFDNELAIGDWFSIVDPPGWSCDMLNKMMPNQMGFCTLSVTATYPDSCELYINVHLDYGLKGPHTDWNPMEGYPDRYDAGDASPWGSADALVDETNSSVIPKPVGIEDCKDLNFSHEELGTTTSFDDTVQNLNYFKRPAGAFGFVSTSSDGQGAGGVGLSLVHPTNGVVHTGETDEDGYYLLDYKHKGKPTVYTIVLDNGSGLSGEAPLKGNGFVEVNFDLTTGTATTEGDEKPGSQGKSGK